MLVTYAGVSLPKCSNAHRELLAGRFRPSSFGLWSKGELSARRERWTFAAGQLNDRPIVFDSIYWPTGAMRWATAFFLVTETQLDEIRETTTFGGSSVAATLAWGPADDQLTAEMYMLPAIPISQVSADLPRRLYLLTLVDERYFWWYADSDIDIDEPCDETWTELYTSVGTALGTTITLDGVESAYLKPCHQLSNHNDPLPQMLDAMAYSVGQRIVRTLDGTVTSQSYANAKAANDALADQTAWNRASGHLLSLPAATAGEPGDISLAVPASVVVSFPRYCSGWYDKTVALNSLFLSGFEGVEGFTGQKCFHDTAVASGTGTPTNQAELDALATQFATDWYRWQTGRVSAVYTCLRNVTPHGLIDSVEWVNDETGIYTVVRRPPFDDKAEELLHCGAYGCSPDCPAEICGRAEVKALTAGCVDSRVPKRVRADICGRAEVKALTAGCVESSTGGGTATIKILIKAYDEVGEVVTAGTDAYLEVASEEQDTHTFHPGGDDREFVFTSAGVGWYLVSISARADVTFSSSQVAPEEVKLEGHLNGTLVRGLHDCGDIAKLATAEDGTGTGTIAHEFDHLCLEATHLMRVTDSSHIFKVKGFASASLDTTFSNIVVSIVKVNRTGLVAE